MNDKPKKDVAASVRDRLQNYARASGQDFQRVLVRYGIERLLYRLAKSPLRERFILKGAMLFTTWADAPFRATGDLDLLGFGDASVETAKSAFASLCGLQTDTDDGLTFPADTIDVERTREDEDYKGLHVRFDARLKNIRIPILIDIGFGDAIHPAALDIDYPTLLDDLPGGNIRAYPPATVIAEKFDAMVRFPSRTDKVPSNALDEQSHSRLRPFGLRRPEPSQYVGNLRYLLATTCHPRNLPDNAKRTDGARRGPIAMSARPIL